MRRLGEKIRTLRERRALTTRQLAELLEIKSHSHIVQLESGRHKPSLDVLVKLMQIFDVGCDQLLKDELEV